MPNHEREDVELPPPDAVPGSEPLPPPAWTGLTAKVALGSFWGIAGQGAIVVASLATAPFVLRLLSTEQYGLLSLLNLLLNYVSLSDLGMQAASTRFASSAHATSGDREEARVIWTSLAVTFLPGVLVAAVLVLSAGSLARLVFRVPPGLYSQATLVFRIGAIILLARNLAGVANTPQLVRLRFDLFTLIGSGGMVAQMLTVPLALYFISRNVGVVATTMAVYALAMLLAHMLVSFRLLPALARPSLNKDIARELVGFGVSLVGMTMLAIALNLEKLFLARFGSLSMLAFYSVAYTLASVPMIAANALGQALLPAFSKLHSTALMDALENLFFRSLRLLALLAIPTMFLLCVFGGTLLHAWAGSVYAANATRPLYILVWGALFDCFAVVPRVLIKAVGRPHTILRFQTILLLPYLLLALLLIAKLGVMGAAAALACRAGAEFLLVYRHVMKTYFPTSALNFRGLAPWAGALGILLLPLLLEPTRQKALVRAFSCISLLGYCWFSYKYLLQDSEKAWILIRLKQRFSFLPESR